MSTCSDADKGCTFAAASVQPQVLVNFVNTLPHAAAHCPMAIQKDTYLVQLCLPLHALGRTRPAPASTRQRNTTMSLREILFLRFPRNYLIVGAFNAAPQGLCCACAKHARTRVDTAARQSTGCVVRQGLCTMACVRIWIGGGGRLSNDTKDTSAMRQQHTSQGARGRARARKRGDWRTWVCGCLANCAACTCARTHHTRSLGKGRRGCGLRETHVSDGSPIQD